MQNSRLLASRGDRAHGYGGGGGALIDALLQPGTVAGRRRREFVAQVAARRFHGEIRSSSIYLEGYLYTVVLRCECWRLLWADSARRLLLRGLVAPLRSSQRANNVVAHLSAGASLHEKLPNERAD